MKIDKYDAIAILGFTLTAYALWLFGATFFFLGVGILLIVVGLFAKRGDSV